MSTSPDDVTATHSAESFRSVPVRFSRLKSIGRSPAHYLYSLRNERPDTAAFRRGRIIDSLVLDQSTPIVYDGTRRGKEWDAFQSANGGADIFTAAEYDAAAPCAESLLRPEHAHALALLRGGVVKRRIAFEWIGRKCGGEPDVAPLVNGDPLVDLKSTRNAQPEIFARDAIRYGYHAQLAWYRMGLERAGLPTAGACYIVAVETSPPYPVVVHRLTERVLEQGDRLCRLWMEKLLGCERSNHWPGYVQNVIDLDAPDDTELTYGEDEGT